MLLNELRLFLALHREGFRAKILSRFPQGRIQCFASGILNDLGPAKYRWYAVCGPFHRKSFGGNLSSCPLLPAAVSGAGKPPSETLHPMSRPPADIWPAGLCRPHSKTSARIPGLFPANCAATAPYPRRWQKALRHSASREVPFLSEPWFFQELPPLKSPAAAIGWEPSTSPNPSANFSPPPAKLRDPRREAWCWNQKTRSHWQRRFWRLYSKFFP